MLKHLFTATFSGCASAEELWSEFQGDENEVVGVKSLYIGSIHLVLFSNLDKNVATIKMAISNTHLLLFWKFSKAQITSRYSYLTATSHHT